MRTLKLLAAAGLALLFVVTPARAQTVGTCSPAIGEAYLDINNVRARILNNGNLFYRGEPHVYEVPKGSGSNAIFASGIWLGGQVGGVLRLAATRYGPYEYWAGPLDASGNPPNDCSAYDRVYKVSDADVDAYDQTGTASPDLADWPTGLGAPTLDADGNTISVLNQSLASRKDRKINLAAGERPAFVGNQMLWWVMNDMGNTHNASGADPMGVEVHGLAFAFDAPGHIGNTTFYKYNIFYKGTVPLTETYMGIFSDPDLGDFADDWVGSDSTLGLGYVYNSDNSDISGEGYGTPPPAAGYDFFQGPIVPAPGETAKVSGTLIPDFKNLGMTAFVYYNNGGGVTEDPRTAEDYYNYMRANWKDGKKITEGGNGRDFSEIPTQYMFSGDAAACAYWSECNSDGAGSSISPGDRRFVLATGPFTINPGDQQEIVFGLVFAKGADHLDSVNELRRADALAQAAFDVNFDLADPPATPTVTVTELNKQVILEWSNSPNSNNFLDSYRQLDPFAPPGSFYEFEGYDIIQYGDVSDQIGKVIATYDKVNGVTRVIDDDGSGVTFVSATGSDNGLSSVHSIGGLINFKTYFFGVQAYAYNSTSLPQVFRSSIARVTAEPAPSTSIISDDARALAAAGGGIVFNNAGNIGQGVVSAKVVNPARLRNGVYTVNFYPHPTATTSYRQVAPVMEDAIDVIDPLSSNGRIVARKAAEGECLTYDIKRDGEVVFNGSATDRCAPQRENVIAIDGLLFSVTGPPPGLASFDVVSNAAGPIDPPECGAFAFNSSGFPLNCGIDPPNDRPNGVRQQVGFAGTSSMGWGIHKGGGSSINYGPESDSGTYLGRAWGSRSSTGSVSALGSYDYEMRFTADGGRGWRPFDSDLDWWMDIPFSIWQTGIATPDDPSDDIRMVPGVCESACGAGLNAGAYDINGDHPISGGTNDPFSDWVYWFMPDDETPGEAGYNDFFFGPGGAHEMMARQVLVCWNCGSARPYNMELPETGTTFRYVTLKPNADGDTFTLNTGDVDGDGSNRAIGALTLAELNASDPAAAKARAEAALETIGIVPNPYKGASLYERSQLIDQVRFTNLPETATIRVFTLNGTLIRTLEKSGSATTLPWDLTTDNQLPIASGLYLIHVEVPNVGEHIMKFAVVKKRTHLNVF